VLPLYASEERFLQTSSSKWKGEPREKGPIFYGGAGITVVEVKKKGGWSRKIIGIEERGGPKTCG